MNAYEAAYVPLRPCAVREGAVFSEPRPFFLRPRPFRPALVLPLKARLGEDAIQFKLLSLRIRGWFGSISIISYHFDFPLSLIHISEPTRLGMISYAVFCLKKKKIQTTDRQKSNGKETITKNDQQSVSAK